VNIAAIDRKAHRKRNSADWEKGRALYPEMDDPAEKWAVLLADKPDVLMTMIADIVKVAKATEGGARRTGRRPVVAGMTFDEVWATLQPDRFSMQPFADSFAALIADRGMTQRQFCQRLPWSQSSMSRLLSGQLTPDLKTLEAIASVAKVSPAYFLEYRAYLLGHLVAEVLQANPHLSITIVKRMARGAA
jgi:hypothetical protein